MSDDLVKLKDAWNKVIDTQNKRISELEKKMIPNPIKLTEQLVEFREQIAELREWYPQIEKNMNHCQKHTTEIGINKRELNELKESVKALGSFSNEHAYEIVNQEDVLRELWNTYILLEVFGATHPIYESLRISIRKLDGVGSARQTEISCEDSIGHVFSTFGAKKCVMCGETEKKEVCECGHSFLVHDPLSCRYCTCLVYEKASGGEKELNIVEESFVGKDPKSISNNNSKLSESKCSFCGRDLIRYKETWICGHGCTKPAIKPDEKTPEPKLIKKWNNCPSCYNCPELKVCGASLKGSGIEPREDGTPNNPILRALFFVGDEECICDWRFRYKREYFEIMKREERLK